VLSWRTTLAPIVDRRWAKLAEAAGPQMKKHGRLYTIDNLAIGSAALVRLCEERLRCV
jgi:hypothetical protein